MPRIAAIIALGLMLLTGIAIGQLQHLGVSGVQPAAVPSSETSLAVDGFYAAINLLLRTGNPAMLREIVDPDYVEHHELVDESSGIDTLEHTLLSLRADSPNLQVVTTRITGGQGLVAVHMQMTGMTDLTLAGLAVDPAPPGDGYEILRIQRGRVIERWTTTAMPVRFQTIAMADRLELSARLRQPILERLTLIPGARLETGTHQGTIIIAETGSIRLQVPERSIPPIFLELGAAKVIEPESAFQLWNAGRESAALLMLSVRQLDSASAFTPDSAAGNPTSGISRELLAGGTNLRPSQGPFELLVGHAVALPGTVIPRHVVNEAELLLVAGGSLEASVASGDIWTVANNDSLQAKRGTQPIGAGQAVSAGVGAELSYQVTGTEPATFWLITIMPEG